MRQYLRGIVCVALILAIHVQESPAETRQHSTSRSVGSSNLGARLSESARVSRETGESRIVQVRDKTVTLLGREYRAVSTRNRASKRASSREAVIELEIDLAGRTIALGGRATYSYPVLGTSATVWVSFIPVTVTADISVSGSVYGRIQYGTGQVAAQSGIEAGLALTLRAGVGLSFRGFRIMAGFAGTATIVQGRIEQVATFSFSNTSLSYTLTGTLLGEVSISAFAEAGPFRASTILWSYRVWTYEVYRWSGAL